MIAIIASDIHLVPNWTLLIQLGIFLTVIIFLQFFIFRPTLHILHKRKAATMESSDEAKNLEATANQMFAEQEAALKEALFQSNAQAHETVMAATEKAKAIIALSLIHI